MKEFKYLVLFKNGEEKEITLEADSVLDGHYRIYREYGRTYARSTYLG